LEKKVDGPRLELPRQVEANGRRQPASALAAQAPQAPPGKRRVLGGRIADDPVRTMPVSRLGFFNLLKQFCAIATGYHKLARNFLAGVPTSFARGLDSHHACIECAPPPHECPIVPMTESSDHPFAVATPTYFGALPLLVESMKRAQHTPLPYR
jgi:hypothetical protein